MSMITSSIEVLETRIAPAVVTVTFVNGVLTLSGDNGNADVAINGLGTTAFELLDSSAPGPGEHTVFHMDGVPDSSRLVLTGAIKSINATFGSGDDGLGLINLNVAGDVTINTGDGSNAAAFGEFTSKGSVKVTGGTGDDAVYTNFSVSIKKDLIVALGEGSGWFTGDALETRIGGLFSYTGGGNRDEVKFTSATLNIAGGMSITTGAGNTIVDIVGNHLAIGKKLIVDSTGSLGIDDVSFNLVTELGKIGELQVTDGAADQVFRLSTGTKNGAGKVNVVTGAGDLEFFLGPQDLLLNAASGGPVAPITIDASASSSTQGSVVAGLGGLNFKGSATGDDSLLILLDRGGGMVIDLGDGANEAQISALGSAKAIQITGGDNTDILQVTVANGKASSLTIDTGGGSDKTAISAINGGVSGALTVTSSGTGSTLASTFVKATIGSFNFTSTAAVNDVSFNTTFAPIAAGPLGTIVEATTNGLTVKNLLVKTGGGNDKVDIGSAVRLNAGSIVLDLGDGTNEVISRPAYSTLKSLSVIGGSGDDTVTLDGLTSSLGAVSLSLGAGKNDAVVAGSANPLRLASLTYLSTSGVGQTDSLTLANILIAGKLDTKFGADASGLSIENAMIGGLTTIDTGAGNDSVLVDVDESGLGSSFAKAVSILLGDGTDGLALGFGTLSAMITAKAAFSADGGTGLNLLANPAGNVFKKTPIFTNFV